MKIIEAMKRIKANKEKIADLQQKIRTHAANLSFETPVYGGEAREKIKEWVQSACDTAKENVRLLTAIARTNLRTEVTIELGEARVTKTITEWVWRRREYAATDLAIFQCLNDRGLKEGHLPQSTGTPMEVKIVRHYDPEHRDKWLAIFSREPHDIDAALEVVNATTDLIEA